MHVDAAKLESLDGIL